MEKSQYLIFNGYRVENINYNYNNKFQIDEENNIIPEFGFALIKSPDNPKEYNVVIGFSYTDKQNQPFVMEAVIRGFFEVGDDKSENILFNAFGILFPYVRSLISDMTRYSITPIIIPTINIVNEIENLGDLYISSENYVSFKINKR
ncbi:protein-export chaperone SecB [Fusobacterium hwasookii]|uniref:protein-export chaperone SecB n=1 Tax=Fusobacterium hwasookii TaxID=1583098 RepID=UPI000495F88F|nr:protein-export chaperone SecB [Fusobacterium hwasookii]QNE69095.1 protein-export chaperone SecB [Fusobacterium hwasookii]